MMGSREEREKKRMSIAGKLRNRLWFIRYPGGFTLIELTIVILLMGFMLSFTLPRVRDVALSDNLKSTVRLLTSTIKELRYQAIKDNQEYFLKFDFASKKFWSDSPYLSEDDRAVALKNAFSPPPDVSVIDICLKDDKKYLSGTISISFSREGYISPSVIHLGSEDGRQFTLSLRPFLGNVDVLEEYVEIEDVVM
jgi:prepilin-type N-terminal cleavage/methylation domain-containing protein